MSKRKIPRNRKVSGVFLLPGNIKIMKNNSILKYGYLMKSLLLNEEEPIYGKYGMLRKQFLKEHRSAKYQYLLLTGKLTEHLNQIEYSCAVGSSAIIRYYCYIPCTSTLLQATACHIFHTLYVLSFLICY